jgi:DNA-binding beta-propeller fold protein YncE
MKRRETKMGPFSRDLKANEFPEGARWLNIDRPLRMADLKGRIVLLDFWTYCCINCMHAIPDLKALEEKYPHLVVIGVHSAKFAAEREVDNIRHAVLRYDLQHPILVDNDLALWSAYRIRAWPSFVLIDPVGYVAAQASGEDPFTMFDDAIASMTQAFDEEGLLEREPMKFDLVRDRTAGAALSYPGKVEADAAGKRLFVSDSGHNRIVVFRPDGEITEVIGGGTVGRADGTFRDAQFHNPQGMAYHPEEDVLYVADTGNHLIRKVDLSAKTVRTILGKGYQGGHVGKGKGTDLALSSPWDLTILGDHLYIAMAGPHQLWRMDMATREAERYAGAGHEDIIDGDRERAALAQPSGIDTDGARIFFADSEVSAVRVVQDDEVRTLVGKGLFEFGDMDGRLPMARFQHPLGVLHNEGTVLVADTYNHKIKLIDLELGSVHTLVGTGTSGDDDGPGRKATLSEPGDIALLDGNLYIADTNNHLIRLFDPASDRLFTFRFRNEEVLWPRPEECLERTRVVLPPVEIGSGEARVHLKLVPPDGWAWNPDAPNHLKVEADDGLLSLQDLEFQDCTWDQDVLISALEEGTTSLVFDLIAYYCGEDQAEVCRFSALELVLPVTVTASGPSLVQAEHRLVIE